MSIIQFAKMEQLWTLFTSNRRKMVNFHRFAIFLKVLLLSTYLQGQTVIWQEDFSAYSDGATTAGDNLPNPPGPPGADGLTDWSISYGGSGNFSIQSNLLEASGMDALGTWTSQKIDISSYNFIFKILLLYNYLYGF